MRELIKTVGEYEFFIIRENYGEDVFGWEIKADGYLYQWKHDAYKTRKGAERGINKVAKACGIK